MSPLGSLLTNESVCELMQSCFRMCFIERANELLRKSAEAALTEMINLLFSRLHSFPVSESSSSRKHKHSNSTRFTELQPAAPITNSAESQCQPELIVNKSSTKNGNANDIEKGNQPVILPPAVTLPVPENGTSGELQLPTTPGQEVQVLGVEDLAASNGHDSVIPSIQVQEPTPKAVGKELIGSATGEEGSDASESLPVPVSAGSSGHDFEFKTRRGVKFTATSEGINGTSLTANKWEESLNGKDVSKLTEASTVPVQPPARPKITAPYGIPCVRELFRFLISLVNPHDPGQNSEVMIHVGLKLLMVTVETGIDSIFKHPALMSLIKNELCKNLLALLSYQPPHNSPLTSTSVLLNVFRIFLLIFDVMRHSLKFQLEVFFLRVGELISESSSSGAAGSISGSSSSSGTFGASGSLSHKVKWNVEQREIALYFLVQLWKLPCLLTEPYLNYDCDLYCSNLFEETTKLFSKNAFSLQSLQNNANSSVMTTSTTQQSISSTHLLCLDGLVSILDGIEIEMHCTSRIVSSAANNSVSSVISDESNCSSVFYYDHDTYLGGGYQSQSHDLEDYSVSTLALAEAEDTPTTFSPQHVQNQAQGQRRRGFVNRVLDLPGRNHPAYSRRAYGHPTQKENSSHGLGTV